MKSEKGNKSNKIQTLYLLSFFVILDAITALQANLSDMLDAYLWKFLHAN